MEHTVELKERRTLVANRVPPGDRWVAIDNDVILDSLTDLLEHVYQKRGNTQFIMDARQGTVHVIETKEVKVPIIPKKTYGLYGEG